MTTEVEVYEFGDDADMLEPKSNRWLTTFKVPDGAPVPVAGDTIALMLHEKPLTAWVVRGRSLLVSDAGADPREARLMSTWIFVSKTT